MDIQWDEWLNLHDCLLWEAVALSLSFDPYVLRESCPRNFRTEVDWPDLERADPLYFRDYGKRLRILKNQIGRPGGPGGYVGASRVQLVLFAKWARKLRWEMPEELKKLARKRPAPNKASGASPATATPANSPSPKSPEESNDKRDTGREMSTKGRRTALLIIRALEQLAERKKGHRTEAQSICDTIASMGYSLTDRAVGQWLKDARKEFPPVEKRKG